MSKKFSWVIGNKFDGYRLVVVKAEASKNYIGLDQTSFDNYRSEKKVLKS